MRIVKVPSSQGSLEKNNGCEDAPDLLAGKLAVENLEVDSVKVIPDDIESTDGNIYSKAKEAFGAGEKPVFIGGDHSITYPIFRAFSEEHQDCALIVFDAHADAMKGIKPVSHEDMNRELIDDGLLAKKNLLLVGVRKIWEQEKEFLEENKIRTISSEKIKTNLDLATGELDNFLQGKENVYLSIDIDVLDPGVSPGTGYLEKDGIDEEELSKLVSIVLESGKVKGLDLVEVNPQKDAGEKTMKIASWLLNKLHI